MKNIQDSSIKNLEKLYSTEELNKDIMQRVAKKCYLPANKTWLSAIDTHKKDQRKEKIAFSLTATVLEQDERYQTDVIDSLKQ